MVKILFLCTGNSGRAQMAEGMLRNLAQGPIQVLSAGIDPDESVHPSAIEVMREIGLDISDQVPKLFLPDMQMDVTKTISLGCDVEENCPVSLVWTEIDSWDLDDPSGASISFFREIRDKIYLKVTKLLKGYNIPCQALKFYS